MTSDKDFISFVCEQLRADLLETHVRPSGRLLGG